MRITQCTLTTTALLATVAMRTMSSAAFSRAGLNFNPPPERPRTGIGFCGSRESRGPVC